MRMESWRTMLPSALLGGVIVLELLFLPGSAPRPLTSLAANPAHVPPSLAEDPQRWAAAALARPLFSPDRQAVAAPGAPATASGLPRLSGILIAPGQRKAVFALPGGGVLTASEGGAVGAFQVQSIASGEVVLTGQGRTQTLRPRFDQGPAPIAPVAAVASAPTVPFSLPMPPLSLAPPPPPSGPLQ